MKYHDKNVTILNYRRRNPENLQDLLVIVIKVVIGLLFRLFIKRVYFRMQFVSFNWFLSHSEFNEQAKFIL